MIKTEKSAYLRSSLQSCYADYSKTFLNIEENLEQSFTFLANKSLQVLKEERQSVKFNANKFEETGDETHPFTEGSCMLSNRGYKETNSEESHIEHSLNDKEFDSMAFSKLVKDGTRVLAFDGSRSLENAETNVESRKKPGSVKTNRNEEHRRSRNQSEKSTKEFSEHGIQECVDKDERKGKSPSSQPIKACNCQELSPEQKEEDVKPPPCNCDSKLKKRSTQEKKEKYKECLECDRIKLNANLIRAIQRINELQAHRKLTESDVKVILEEEYHGDIFGYREQKKVKGPEATKKAGDEVPLKTIAEREQEMREEFKQIIENEVSKFEDRKKKKVAAPLKAPPQKEDKSEEQRIPKKKKKKTKELSLDMQDVLYWMYPRHHFGHKHCLPLVKEVPKGMGWLWNSSKGAGLLKPGRGWVPGAIRRDVLEVMKQKRKDRRGVEEDEEERTVARSSQRSGTSKSKDNQRGYVDRYNPTFHMHKKDGYYYFSLYPIKTDQLEKMGQDPKPTMFKVSAKQPDGSEGWSTDDESYEIEFVTPSAMKKQIKKPLKKNISQQYLEDDFVTKKKEKVPEHDEIVNAPAAKKSVKGKGKPKKNKKK